MAKNASFIRSIYNRYESVQGLMVAAMSGKSVEIRTGRARLHSKVQPIPALGHRQIKVIKKGERCEQLVTSAAPVATVAEKSADEIPVEFKNLIPVNNRQSGTQRRVRNNHMIGGGFEHLTSQDCGLIDYKRQRRFDKGARPVAPHEFPEEDDFDF